MCFVTAPYGGKLSCKEIGSGSTVILVHGSPGEGKSWGRVAPHLPGRAEMVKVFEDAAA